MTAGDAEVIAGGQSLVLLPERAAFWRETGTLLVADPHFGKAAAFRAGGFPVPAGTTGESLSRLHSAVSRMAPRRIVFLGDLLHARSGRSPSMLAALTSWRSDNEDVDVLLVRGNHDRHAGDPPAELGVECVDEPHPDGPFILSHHPVASVDGYVIAGHTHPGVRLYGAGGERARLPCFVVGSRVTVLPAFGDFTGLADGEPDPDADIYVVADNSVLRID